MFLFAMALAKGLVCLGIVGMMRGGVWDMGSGLQTYISKVEYHPARPVERISSGRIMGRDVAAALALETAMFYGLSNRARERPSPCPI